jgi:hypothetical protein
VPVPGLGRRRPASSAEEFDRFWPLGADARLRSEDPEFWAALEPEDEPPPECLDPAVADDPPPEERGTALSSLPCPNELAASMTRGTIPMSFSVFMAS